MTLLTVMGATHASPMRALLCLTAQQEPLPALEELRVKDSAWGVEDAVTLAPGASLDLPQSVAREGYLEIEVRLRRHMGAPASIIDLLRCCWGLDMCFCGCQQVTITTQVPCYLQQFTEISGLCLIHLLM